MSKQNREKRKWKCGKCGGKMNAVLGRVAQKKVDATKVKERRLIHACGVCNAFHYEDGGGLRLLTLAEEFVLRMEVPNAVARAEARKMPVGGDFGILEFASD